MYFSGVPCVALIELLGPAAPRLKGQAGIACSGTGLATLCQLPSPKWSGSNVTRVAKATVSAGWRPATRDGCSRRPPGFIASPRSDGRASAKRGAQPAIKIIRHFGRAPIKKEPAWAQLCT
jgi:hypothetical protein